MVASNYPVISDGLDVDRNIIRFTAQGTSSLNINSNENVNIKQQYYLLFFPDAQKNYEKLKAAYPEVEFKKHIDFESVYEKEFDIPWEVDKL